jgi:hypothetical protein
MTQHAIPEAVLKQHIAILGKTGSGKTSTAKLAVEQVVEASARVCVLDTIKSDWWGITSSASGKRPGLPFKILGGPRGHVPLHSNAGKVIGQLVAEGKLPLSIIDMADFEAGGVQRFFVDFAQSLFRHMRGMLYLVIEEAHEVAPKERAGFGAENLSIHWAKKLATAGRSKGIRLIVSSQSVQQLHNRVLGACETLIAHRLTTPADQKPILDWLKANAKPGIIEMVSAQLSSIKTGSGWICSGEAQIFEREDFPKFKTFDNSKTPDGDAADIDVTTAAVDQDELRSIIGDAVKEAEATDPKALRAEIVRLRTDKAALERQMAEAIAAKVVSDPDAIKKAEQCGFEQAEKKLTNAMRRELNKKLKEGLAVMRKYATEAVDHIDEELREIHAKDAELIVEFVPTVTVPKAVPPRPAPSSSPQKPSYVKTASNGDGALEKPLQTIVDAIRWWNVLGVPTPSHPQVAFAANYSHKSGTWATYLSRLRSMGFIERGHLILTAEGAAAANEPGVPPDAEHLRQKVLGKLDAPLVKIMSPIIGAYPDGLTHQQASDSAGYSAASGTWATYLSRLRSLDLIEGRGELKAQEWLFP